jgi:hypothetical protein
MIIEKGPALGMSGFNDSTPPSLRLSRTSPQKLTLHSLLFRTNGTLSEVTELLTGILLPVFIHTVGSQLRLGFLP